MSGCSRWWLSRWNFKTPSEAEWRAPKIERKLNRESSFRIIIYDSRIIFLSATLWFSIIIKSLAVPPFVYRWIQEKTRRKTPQTGVARNTLNHSRQTSQRTLIANLLQLNDYISWPDEKAARKFDGMKRICNKFSCKSLLKIRQSDVKSVNDDDPWFDFWTVDVFLFVSLQFAFWF